MTQTALRAVQHNETAVATPASRTLSRRLGDIADETFKRVVLIVLFTVFLAGLIGVGNGLKMANNMEQMGLVLTEVSNTTSGNRVVSCTDLSLQAPEVAATLPQCAAGVVGK